MGKIINSPTNGGGGNIDLSFITADSSKILSGYIGSDIEGNPVEGSMVDNGAKTTSLNAGGSYTIPAGYHNGSGKVTANSLSSQTAADAVAGDILSGKNAWVNGVKVNGSMPNQGAKTASLNAGGSYTIPAGYHNGSGKVTANSLSSQTSATATASDILSGKSAWVNGVRVNGNIASMGAQTITPIRFKQQTIQCAGKMMSGNILVDAIPTKYGNLYEKRINIDIPFTIPANSSSHIGAIEINKHIIDIDEDVSMARLIIIKGQCLHCCSFIGADTSGYGGNIECYGTMITQISNSFFISVSFELELRNRKSIYLNRLVGADYKNNFPNPSSIRIISIITLI